MLPCYVWYNCHGEGRNRLARFRRTVTLPSAPTSAELCLFGDTVYQVFVNGSFISFGPPRFDRRFPLHDRIDLAPYLRGGRNVIAVQVKSFGCKTFKDTSIRGGFVAWGELTCDDGSVFDLATHGNSEWKARRGEALDAGAMKISFALDPLDLFDEGRDEPEWTRPDFDDTAWKPAIAVEDQTTWGFLRASELPTPDLREVDYSLSRPIQALKAPGHLYAVVVPGHELHTAEAHFARQEDMSFVVATYLHSPRAQVVTAEGFRFEAFLNGNVCPVEHDEERLRDRIEFSLREGWNTLLLTAAFMLNDVFNLFLCLPAEANLQLSPARQAGDDRTFMRSAVVSREVVTALTSGSTLPLPGDDSLDDHGGWIEVNAATRDGNPAHRCLWDEYSEGGETATPGSLTKLLFTRKRFPHGFSVFVELPTMHLIWPEIGLEGAKGAEVDLAYSEHLQPDDQHLHHRHYYMAGDRFLPACAKSLYRPTQPRGARYLRITVRGARGDVRFASLRFLNCRYPVTPRGAFECSDPLLNEIWQLCLRTQQANMEDVFVDCTGRERGMYLRDTIIQFHNTLAAFGDVQMMGRCMELFGQSADESGRFRCVYPNKGDYVIADFAIEAIEGYWRYYQSSGDAERLRRDWAAMRGNMEWFHTLSNEREDGFLDADYPRHRKVDAHYGAFLGDNGASAEAIEASGPCAHLTFPYLTMLRAASRIANVVGDEEQARALQGRRRDILLRARSAFWDEAAQAFCDNLTRRTHSLQANALAVNAGVASPSQCAAIREHCLRRWTTPFVNGKDPADGTLYSPAYAFFIFEMFYRLDLAELAEQHFRIGWGWMVRVGLPTAPEFFSLDESRCHAWSASPLYYLSSGALGVSFPHAPCFDLVEIRLQTGLQWARGAFPIPGSEGLIEVEWKRDDQGRPLVRVETPAGVQARIVSPSGEPTFDLDVGFPEQEPSNVSNRKLSRR